MQVRRGRHHDIPPAPWRELLGILRWCGEGEDPPADLIVHVDVTLYLLESGVERCEPPPPGALYGAPIEDRQALVLGKIRDYDHRDVPVEHWRPYVRCVPGEGIPEVPEFREWVPEEEIREGLEVEVAFETPLTGTVTREVYRGNLLAECAVPRVPMFEVTVSATVTGSTGRGTPVVREVDGRRELAGMVLELFAQDDESTRLTCYPAVRMCREGEAPGPEGEG